MLPLVEGRFCANAENILVQLVFALMRYLLPIKKVFSPNILQNSTRVKVNFKKSLSHVPKRAGEKPKEKKKKKGQNNVEQKPVDEEVILEEEDVDFPKPLAFTDIWHNKNDFKVFFLQRTTQKQSDVSRARLNLLEAELSAYRMILLLSTRKGSCIPKGMQMAN